MTTVADFNAIRISLASPEQIKQWSYGEVVKPETINYRTLRPEKDGLFCERIFGPTKDWECFCGKYKKIRFRGVICDRCGVEVARAKVRRERMGHITLAAPVAHIWFAKGIPSRLGLLLDLSPRDLERVLYFAKYIVISVDGAMRDYTRQVLEEQHKVDLEKLEQDTEARLESLRAEAESAEDEKRRAELEEQIGGVQVALAAAKEGREKTLKDKVDALDSLRPLQLLTDAEHRELQEQFSEIFKAGMGAESILQILRQIDLNEEALELEREVRTTSGQRRKKAVKRIRVIEAFRKSGNKAEWMVLTALPVLPPDLRPMVQLDGGRFATSDLNDLYRRVINRNNRLRRLLDLGAPDIIVRNEKRMLQEAVDDLIDNGRRGRPVVGSHNHKLKSLSDLLRGKQGRFRQNLLGKRVDYGGRSVIVVGPGLQLHECGLPKKMALELFKPFVMNRLVLQGLAHNIKSAKRMVDRSWPEVWDILEDVIKGRPVLLNRAPTLHRLGIQAFMPVLVEGSAIQIHPLVCAAFNADFDGDQMAVHVPLSLQAVQEARNAMLSIYNMLSPSSGEPMVAPTYEIVLGCYYLTSVHEGAKGEGARYRDLNDVLMAHDAGLLDLQSEVHARDEDGEWVTTTPGRIIFNNVLPKEVRRYDTLIDKKALKDVVTEVYRLVGNDQTSRILDEIKHMGFRYATVSGTTIGITDIRVPPEKQQLVAEAERQIDALEDQYEQGLITEREKYNRTVAIWQGVSNQMDSVLQQYLPEFGGIYAMAHSGARGNEAQIKQMAAMRGLMSNPRGDIIDLPIKSSFREGLSVLEYFISTHGARKGLADTALRTADSGYLTRRLIDVSQEVIVLEEDCNTDRGVLVYADPTEEDVMIGGLAERIIGRAAAAPVVHPHTGEIIAAANETIEEPQAVQIMEAGVTEVYVRSPLACQAARGLCKVCYGRSPATGRPARLGEAVGIIAAQSIGEPGTQLTMRTFHTGGVAGKDITSGLPRVEELFEARAPRGKARLAEIDGDILVFDGGVMLDADRISQQAETEAGAVDWEDPMYKPPVAGTPVVRVVNSFPFTDAYAIPEGYAPAVANGDRVEAGAPIAAAVPSPAPEASDAEAQSAPVALPDLPDLLARVSGSVKIADGRIEIETVDVEIRDHAVDATDQRLVRT
ncbi:MAG: DNA-directed RNA polymerase subunit beta', partial [Dehalococcoidia bacterium]|nr:DNA-directed RNA polymerase subunit beta' [Dehalococcoidia bacterium]